MTQATELRELASLLKVDSGNVGIGPLTGNPAHTLTLGQANVAGEKSILLAGSGNPKHEIMFREASLNYGFTLRYSGDLTDNILDIVAHENSADGVSAIAIKRDGGNVGIGTIDPQTSLHLSKATTGPIIRLQNSTNGIGENILLGGIEWFSTDSSGEGPNVVSAIESYSGSSYGNDGYLTFSTYNSSESDSEGQRASEKMRLMTDGKVGIGTVAPTEKLEVAGTAKADQYLIDAIAKDISDTAVDVFVYDTRKDSDGGAWRKRTQNTSWYNEALNTATRGARKEFPSVAVIVVESKKITIYDGDDPDMPMWMVFNVGVDMSNETLFRGATASSLAMLNATLCVGTSDTMGLVSFIDEYSNLYHSSQSYYWPTRVGIIDRNVVIAEPESRGNGIGLVNAQINDISMTVLPNAPIDLTTGLPVPTIAVATAGGVSVIKDDGSVVDITVNNASYTIARRVNFLSDNSLGMGIGVTNGVAQESYYVFNNIPTIDNVITVDNIAGTVQNVDEFYAIQPPNGLVDLQLLGLDTNRALLSSTGNSFASNEGLSVISRNVGAPDKGLISYITSDYNTGWMHGDIKLATLSDTDTTNVTYANIVTNGTFSNTTDWYGLFASISVVSGKIRINRGASASSNGNFAVSPISCNIGRQYRVTYTQSSAVNCSPIVRIGIGSNNPWSNLHSTGTTGTHSFNFVATQTTHYFYLGQYSTATNSTIDYDDVSIQLLEEDRSVNNNSLQVFGTVTKTAVATGADLVGYSGFNGSNYLRQPYNSDLDFGTGDFSYSFWHNCSSSGSDRIWLAHGKYNTASSGLNILQLNSAGDGDTTNFYVGNSGAGAVSVSKVEGLGYQNWVVTRRSGVVYVYRNSKLEGSIANTMNINLSAQAIDGLYLGAGYTGSSVFPYGASSLALFRASATAPSPEQIAKMYNDEKHLFATNAKATLYGTSDAVTALAYDDDTELLHVGTSAGRSVFQGLNRVDNTTDAVGAAISASNGLVAED